jgi:uncharacterized membrane protein YeaQ/YmgE (transglycosylase-associated protein family)
MYLRCEAIQKAPSLSGRNLAGYYRFISKQCISGLSMITVAALFPWFSTILAERWRTPPERQGRQGGNMSLLAWIVLGLLAGFIGSKLVNKRGEGLILDVLLGVVGAVVGGWLFRSFGSAGVTGLNLYSLLVAVVGAVVVLFVYHALRRA